MAFVGSFISAAATAFKAGGAISALKTASLATKIGIGVGKAAYALAPIAKVAAIGYAGSKAMGMLSQQGGAQQPQVGALPATPNFSDAQDTAREDELKRVRRRTNTILTNPSGLLTTDSSQKSLLGG